VFVTKSGSGVGLLGFRVDGANLKKIYSFFLQNVKHPRNNL